MTIYILVDRPPYESSHIWGVFSTYELAEETLNRVNNIGLCLQIEEFELDKYLYK